MKKSSEALLLNAEIALQYLDSLGIQYAISLEECGNKKGYISVVTLSVETTALAQGISWHYTDKYISKCVAILESLERLYFKCISSTSSKIYETIREKIYSSEALHLKLDSKTHTLVLHQKSIFSHPEDSTGWAISNTVSDACERAMFEVLERDVFNSLDAYSDSLRPFQLASNNLLKYMAISSENGLYSISGSFVEGNFSAVCLYSSPNRKSYFGSAFGNDSMEKIWEKAAQEAILESHFFANKYSTAADLSIVETFSKFSQQNHEYSTEVETRSIGHDFAFTVFPIQTYQDMPKLFVAYAYRVNWDACNQL